MTPLEIFVGALDTAFWEPSVAFKGLEDRDVWVRPHPRLLSIRDIASNGLDMAPDVGVHDIPRRL